MPTDRRREILRRLKALPLLAGLLLASSAAAAEEDILAEYNYYESGKIELNDGNFQQAITHYSNLEKLYPKSAYIPQAQLEKGYAYYKLGNANAAIAQLKEFLTDENRHPHKPYAFYLAGLSRYQEALQLMETNSTRDGADRARRTTQQAIDYFTHLVEKFPASMYSEDARQKITYLLEKMVLLRIKTEGEILNQDRVKRIKAESDRSQAWLMKQPANHYTLQLVRAPDYDTAFKTALQYQLESKAMIIETDNGTGPGHTLLYGVYSSKRAAMEAGASLPPAILQAQPLVREMSSLHAEIVESRLIASGAKHEPQSDAQSRLAPPPAAAGTPAAPADDGTGGRYNDHEQWLLSQPADAYTVQLMGTGSEEKITTFITANNLGAEARYYRYRRKDGRDWFSLLYGSYPSRQEAIAGGEQISGQLRIAQPWIRGFKGIHNEIRATPRE